MVPLAPGLVLIAPWVALLVLDVVGYPPAGFILCAVGLFSGGFWLRLGEVVPLRGVFGCVTGWSRLPSESSWLLSG